MWSIRQTDNGWDVLDSSGAVLTTRPTYQEALADLATLARTALAAEQAAPVNERPTGAMPRRWVSGDRGMVLAENTGDGRDFTGCTFTWRPLSEYPLPLMFQTSTDVGHFGATLVGWWDHVAGRDDGGVDAGGWFHDTEAGRNAYAVLEAQGRIGVSADPGAVEWEDVCTEYDVDGFCVDGYTAFHSYEVIGGTMCPFPGFGQAWLTLEAESAAAAPAEEAAEAVAAGAGGQLVTVGGGGGGMGAGGSGIWSGGGGGSGWSSPQLAQGGVITRPRPAAPAPALQLPAAPPAWAFTMDEPDDDDPRYVDQGGGRLGIPLTLSDEGHLYGHGAVWGTCHIGYQGRCVEPPLSPSNCARFNLGETLAADGTRHTTGALVLGLDHAGRQLTAAEARDNYAHTGMAFADAHARNGRHGYWLSGWLRPTVGPELARVIRGSCLSGDWRDYPPDGLDLVAFQAVNVPGFPVARTALAAAGVRHLANAQLSARYGASGTLVHLAGAGVVRPQRATLDALAASGTLDCGTCAGEPTLTEVLTQLSGIAALVERLELRTRHLIPAERDAIRASLTR